MPEATDAARRLKLTAIRARAEDHADTTTAALDRRYLLDEVSRLQRELADVPQLWAARLDVLADINTHKDPGWIAGMQNAASHLRHEALPTTRET
jgi:hypothetical protein